MNAKPRFAALGHQENWSQLAAIVRELRPSSMALLGTDDLREIVPWIPPRTVSRFRVAGECGANPVDGVYIDTFITPDELACRPTRRVISKVRDAIAAAEREGVSVATLGGFTSILLEANAIPIQTEVALTTGNTLTAGLMIRGIERALALLHRALENEDVLIVGATGDVGSACARSLSGRVKKLRLCARNRERLEREAGVLALSGPVEWSIDALELLSRASVIIAAASSTEPPFRVDQCSDDAIICDAGYPKNVAAAVGGSGARIFWGGMGVITGGLRSTDGVLEKFYQFPIPDAAHGCMLEAAVLALAGRFESFSRGRGQISPAQIDEMWTLAQAAGVRVAPLFNADGLWPEEQASA